MLGRIWGRLFVSERKGEWENEGDTGQAGGGLAEKLLRSGLSFFFFYLVLLLYLPLSELHFATYVEVYSEYRGL